jgi:hypothetical protein
MSNDQFAQILTVAAHSASMTALDIEPNDLMRQLGIVWFIGCIIGIHIGITDVAQARIVRQRMAAFMAGSEADFSHLDPIAAAIMEAAIK